MRNLDEKALTARVDFKNVVSVAPIEHKHKASVAFVAEKGLCTGCGTCSGVCPNHAIEMQISAREHIYLPQIDEHACVECGLCVRCCPGYSVDSRKLSRKESTSSVKDPIIGDHLQCYASYSKDADIRLGASSGGLITHLLIYLRQKGIIDGALVAKMNPDDPLQPELTIARTKKEIVDAARSKYCPVPSNVSLREIIAQNGKFAVVGLPCHIHGVRLAERYVKGLKDKIVLHIGLFCGHTVDFAGTELLLERLNIHGKDVAELSYRGGGWPGFMSVTLKDGSTREMKFDGGWNAYWNIFSSFLFTPMRCMKCPDQSNEFSDLSFGDAWLKQFSQSKVGMSIIITRTQFAEALLNEMIANRAVSVKKTTSEKVKQSQAFSLNFKKETLSGRFVVLKRLGENLPEIYPILPATLAGEACAFLPYFSRRMSSSKRWRHFFRYVPTSIFRVYFGLFKCLFFMSTRYKVW